MLVERAQAPVSEVAICYVGFMETIQRRRVDSRACSVCLRTFEKKRVLNKHLIPLKPRRAFLQTLDSYAILNQKHAPNSEANINSERWEF